MSKKSILQRILISFMFAALTAGAAFAQGSSFSFQGRLNDGTNPANGSYDLQFRLYTAITGGAQIGELSARPNTTLINGVFSITLDFGATAFNSPNSIFIEIAVKPNGSPNAFTILGPRQQLTVVPFAVRSATAALADNATNAVNAQNAVNAANAQNAVLATNATNATTAANALSLGGVTAGNYLQTNGNGSQLTNVSAVTATTATTANNALSLGGVAANGWARLNVQNTGDLRTTGSLQITGNATQSSTANGLVKAMIYLDAFGDILRCYNGNTGAGTTTGDCGFTVAHISLQGIYIIDFGFQVNNRFYSVMVQKGGNQSFIGSYDFTALPPNQIRIYINKTHESGGSSGADAEFVIIVY